MATAIRHHRHHHHFDGDLHEACLESNCKSCPDLEYEDRQLAPEAVSNFEILDQGSISFGRYANESLAWEKRSVFSHDRYQEELEKFKNPGLVAQKKAYFEDYYKKIRAMKRLQAEEQGTTQVDACQDAQSNKTLEDNVNSIVPKDNNSTKQDLISDNITLSSVDSLGGTVYGLKQATERQERDCNVFNDKSDTNDSKKIRQKKNYVSDEVSHKSNNPKKHVSCLQAKGTIISVRNETELESSRTMRNVIKQPEKPNSTLHRKITNKVDKNLSCKQSDLKAASKHSKPITQTSSPAIVSHSLLERNKLVSSFSSVRTHQMKPRTTSQGLVHTKASKFLIHGQSAKPVLSSSSIRARQGKLSATLQGLVEKFPTKLAVKSQSFKGISRNETATGDLRNKIKRSASLLTLSKSSQNFGELGQRNIDIGGRQKEGKEKLSDHIIRDSKAASSAGIRGDTKPTTSVVSNISKAPNAKLMQKIAPAPSEVDKCDQRPLRLGKPRWR